MKIKVKEITEGCMPEYIEQGDWIDLVTAKSVLLEKGEYYEIPLGIAAQLPDGYEAHVIPRSSTFKKYNVIQANSYGMIDNSYCGDDDQWHFPALAVEKTHIPKGVRICQFRVVERQPRIELIKVEKLGNKNRGGFGSTGE